MFVGTVTDPGSPNRNDSALRDIRVAVTEIFEGLPLGTTSVVVAGEGNWQTWEPYLFDTARGSDGRLYPTICGSTDEISSRYLTGVLAELRLRAQGKAPTSLTVRVQDKFAPLVGAVVSIGGPQGKMTQTTDSNGDAKFSPIPPANYSVTAAKEHYGIDPEMHSANTIEVVSGTCPGSMVALKSEAVVSGLVRKFNGDPAQNLKLDLVPMPTDPHEKLTPFRQVESQTDEMGQFTFEGVSPGRYVLGSNISGINNSPIPPTFYPGSHDRLAAVPLDVKIGEAVENLVFNLPDIGPERQIRLCVIESTGKPVPSAQIQQPIPLESNTNIARLGDPPITDSTGCVVTRGYTQVAYSVRAVLSIEGATFIETIRTSRRSDDAIIPSGNDAINKVLVLRPKSPQQFTD